MDARQFADLIKRYEEGKTTESENAIIEKWLENRGSVGSYEELSDTEVSNMLAEVNENIQYGIQSELKSEFSNNSRNKILPRIAAAAAVVILAVSAFLIYQTQIESATSLAQGPLVLTFEGKRVVTLPDGSAIKLNDNSKLTYTATDTSRSLELIGEAFFDVAHDESKPFTVHSRGVETRVLGTAFNIRAYPGDKEVEVTVARGKVQVGDGSKIYDVLTPNHAVTINTTTLQMAKAEVNADAAITWTKKFFVLDNVSLDSAVMLIGQRFNTNVVLENNALRNCRVYAMFLEGESLTQVLDVITPPVNASYVIDATGKVKLSGKGCEDNTNAQ